ncbi:glycerophosphodiester phosphodiesterase family protein [Atopobacter phocae]|uniref:glycerophosphodiester phosphodiesterase family protein n=1 Tax=Atopobacter phocae TaxID=136492 RepID=UPI0004721A07|nr:glycerophosphodiester phosphodiesterase family protein [Atopobacter phocae]
MDIFAHRGSRSTHPENTLPAFYEAVRLGCEGLECDVHLSLDEQVIVMHDEQVDRTTNKEGLINFYTRMELSQMDAGSWFYKQPKVKKQPNSKERIGVPTLIELLEALDEWNYRGLLNIELKTTRHAYQGLEEKINEAVQAKEWPFKIVYSSFNPYSLIKMKRLDPSCQLAYLMFTLDPASLYFARYFEKEAWHISYVGFVELVQLASASEAFKEYLEQVEIRVWTTNLPEKIAYVFKNNGNAVITDYPERAQFIRMALGGGE